MVSQPVKLQTEKMPNKIHISQVFIVNPPFELWVTCSFIFMSTELTRTQLACLHYELEKSAGKIPVKCCEPHSCRSTKAKNHQGSERILQAFVKQNVDDLAQQERNIQQHYITTSNALAPEFQMRDLAEILFY